MDGNNYKVVFKIPKKSSSNWHYRAKENIEKYFSERVIREFNSSDKIKSGIFITEQPFPTHILLFSKHIGNLTGTMVITKNKISPEDGDIYGVIKVVGRVYDINLFIRVMNYLYYGYLHMVEREEEKIKKQRAQRTRSGKKLKSYKSLAKKRVLRRIEEMKTLLEEISSYSKIPKRLRLYISEWVINRISLDYKNYNTPRLQITHARSPLTKFVPNKVINPWD